MTITISRELVECARRLSSRPCSFSRKHSVWPSLTHSVHPPTSPSAPLSGLPTTRRYLSGVLRLADRAHREAEESPRKCQWRKDLDPEISDGAFELRVA